MILEFTHQDGRVVCVNTQGPLFNRNEASSIVMEMLSTTITGEPIVSALPLEALTETAQRLFTYAVIVDKETK